MRRIKNALGIIDSGQTYTCFFITAFLMLAYNMSVMAYDMSTYDFEVDGIYYDSLSANTCEVVRGEGYPVESLVIPNKVTFAGKDFDVTRIGAIAFYNQSSLKSIHIPSGITAIGREAFMHCSGLTSIEVDAGNPIYSSYEGALYCKDRTSLIYVPAGKTEYVIPVGCVEIRDDAFYLCSSLKHLDVCSTVTKIGSNAFAGCDSLATISIPSGVEYIGDYAFAGCTTLESLVLPSSLKQIGEHVLSFCSSLKTFVWPSAITTIPLSSFEGCTQLESIEIPMGVTAIGDKAFSQCDSLKRVELPGSLETIGSCCFYGCKLIESPNLPNNISMIGSQAFEYCIEVDTITLTAKISEIGELAFNGCKNLACIMVEDGNNSYMSFKGALYDYNLKKLIRVPSVAVSDSILTTTIYISPYAYFGCRSLTKVNIPGSVSTIGKWAFVGCAALDSVYMTTPTDLTGTYLPQNTRTLYVPKGKKSDFEESVYYIEQYSLFKAIEEYGDTPTSITESLIRQGKIHEAPIAYNLMGIKIKEPKSCLKKGVYIVGGKKVVL